MERIYKQLTAEERERVLTEFKRIQDEDRLLELQREAAKKLPPTQPKRA